MDESDSKLNGTKKSQDLFTLITGYENYNNNHVKCNKIPSLFIKFHYSAFLHYKDDLI
jgi:hypothetical protein